MSLYQRSLFAARTAAFAATSATLLSGLELQRRVVPESERHDLAHVWMRRWAKAMLSLFRIELLAAGEHIAAGEPYPACTADGRGRVFIFNHRSAMDIPLVYTLVNSHFVSRHDLAKWPLVGQAARSIGTLFVDRASMRSGAGVLREMTHTLEEGCAVGLFPEGTTFEGDEVRPLRRGAFNAAAKVDAEIVPIGVAYSNPAAAFGDETMKEHMQRISAMRGLKISAVAGEPFRCEQRDMAELRKFGRERLQQLVHEARQRL